MDSSCDLRVFVVGEKELFPLTAFRGPNRAAPTAVVLVARYETEMQMRHRITEALDVQMVWRESLAYGFLRCPKIAGEDRPLVATKLTEAGYVAPVKNERTCSSVILASG